MNTVEALMETPFSTLSLADQLQIKEMGPHRPKLQIQEVTVDRGMQCTRKFSEDWYQKKEWLCGSTPKEALFCFPCLLFGGEKLWTQTGVKDLKDIPQKVNEHEISKMHTDNVMRLYVLGKANIGAELDEEYCASIRRHNQEVDSNRYVLSRIIDCIRFCESLQKAPLVYDEEEQPHSSGVFRNLIEFVASYNDTTKQHWQQATVFRDLEKTIQSKLLDCMLTVARAHIKEELSTAAFVALEVDDIKDVSGYCQNALIFRFMPKDEPPVERFYGVTQLKGPRAETVTTALLQYLEELFPEDADKDKLIAQSYDGASEMPGEEREVQHRIRDTFHNAHYVHSDAHELNHVLQKATSRVRVAREFFRQLSAFPKFFSNYEKGTELLEKVMRRRLPTDVLTGWNMMSLISEKRQELIDCLEEIDDVFYYPLNAQLPAIISFLNCKKFLYWLSFFLRIMPCVNDLDSQLRRRHVDPAAVSIGIRDFVNAITTVRGSIGTLFAELPPETILPSWISKETMDQQASEVCDIIISHIQERLAFNQHLSSARLLDPSLYPAHNQNFPEGTLDEVVKAYPMLNKNRLRTELSTIYAREELYTVKGALEVLQLLVKDRVPNNFPQLVMLLRIFITTPLNTPERQQSFSALKRVKSFFMSSVWEENINTSLMLSVEKEMLKSIPHFNLKVIEVFAEQKEHQAYFMYKK